MKTITTKVAGASAAAGLGLLPLLAFAEPFGQYTVSGNSTGGLQLLLYRVQLIYNQIFPIMLALAVFYFLWGVIGYITAPGDKKDHWGIAYGLVGIFVIVSIWGLVAFIGDTVGIRGTTAPNTLPYVTPTPPNSPAVITP